MTTVVCLGLSYTSFSQGAYIMVYVLLTQNKSDLVLFWNLEDKCLVPQVLYFLNPFDSVISGEAVRGTTTEFICPYYKERSR